MSALTIAMYHYVRDLERSRFPAIKGRRVSEFKAQLDHIASNYQVVTAQQVMAAVQHIEPLPPNAIWLTFDDGYIDHYLNVLPPLQDRGWQGAFFPPSRAVSNGELLDVNKIHFLLAATRSVAPVIEAIREFIAEHAQRGETTAFEEYWTEYARASRFDSADVIFIKRVLQHALPSALRRQLADILFARFVTSDQRAFAQELYLSPEQLQTMIRLGQYVGSHGARHEWLNSLDPVQQAQDVDESLSFLNAIGAPTDEWVMCYPYGAYDQTLLDIVRRRGCVCGITTRVAVANLSADGALELPRVDTNDIPLG
jgi:peptidoglycan/xylan/chitin deacetylase (PgdA/CDA1 family)